MRSSALKRKYLSTSQSQSRSRRLICRSSANGSRPPGLYIKNNFIIPLLRQKIPICGTTVPNTLEITDQLLVLRELLRDCDCEVLNTAKDRRGPTKDRKGPQRTHKGPQRSITQDHRGSAIMRELPDLRQFCLI